MATPRLAKTGANAVLQMQIPPEVRPAIRGHIIEALMPPGTRKDTNLFDVVDGDPNHPRIRAAIVDVWWGNPSDGGHRSLNRATAIEMARVIEFRLFSPFKKGKRGERDKAEDAMNLSFAYALTLFFNGATNQRRGANGSQWLLDAMEDDHNHANRMAVQRMSDEGILTGDPRETEAISRHFSRLSSVWYKPSECAERVVGSLLRGNQSIGPTEPPLRSDDARDEPQARGCAHWLAMVVPTPFEHSKAFAGAIVANANSLFRSGEPAQIAKRYGKLGLPPFRRPAWARPVWGAG